jgi:hypothetical protein
VQTGLSAWVYAIARALDEAGVDRDALMRRVGMDPDRLMDLNHRYFQEQVTSLWIASVEATGDPDFGLKVARHIRPSTFHIVGYAMSCSATLRRAAERFARSARLISDAADVQFAPENTGYRLSVNLNISGRPPIYQTIDTILAGFLMLSEWIAGTPIVPIEVTFRHEAPADDRAYREVFRCPVTFEADANTILFAGPDLERPVPSANEELAMVLDEMTAHYLALRFSSRFARRVVHVDGQNPQPSPTECNPQLMISILDGSSGPTPLGEPSIVHNLTFGQQGGVEYLAMSVSFREQVRNRSKAPAASGYGMRQPIL